MHKVSGALLGRNAFRFAQYAFRRDASRFAQYASPLPLCLVAYAALFIFWLNALTSLYFVCSYIPIKNVARKVGKPRHCVDP